MLEKFIMYSNIMELKLNNYFVTNITKSNFNETKAINSLIYNFRQDRRFIDLCKR